MLMKISVAVLTLLATLLTLSGRALAQPKQYMAEEVEDYFAQKQASKNSILVFSEITAPAATGSLTITGDASPFQMFNRVKAIKCSPSVSGSSVTAVRKSCSDVQYFNLNEARALSPGFYILGFENSIYPGFVQINAGDNKVIALQKISISTDAPTKIFRNLNSAVEQKKLMFTQFQLGKSMFSLAQYSFGDLYLRKFPLRDMMPNIEYSFCDLKWTQETDPDAAGLCRAYKSKSFAAMSLFFEFNSDSTHTESVPRYPGDSFEYSFGRLLVSAPTSGAGSFVNVFAGDYTIESTVAGKPSRSNVSVYDKDASGKSITSFGN